VAASPGAGQRPHSAACSEADSYAGQQRIGLVFTAIVDTFTKLCSRLIASAGKTAIRTDSEA